MKESTSEGNLIATSSGYDGGLIAFTTIGSEFLPQPCELVAWTIKAYDLPSSIATLVSDSLMTILVSVTVPSINL